nr:MAG TPA: hypothetical protein [Caudoviricetes sp.]
MLVLPAVTVLADREKLLARGIVFRVTFPVTVRSVSLVVSPRESKNPFKLMVLVPSALWVTVLLTVEPIFTQLVPMLKLPS